MSSDAISGMHTPSGENMWASPADDEKSEEELDKKAMGLTSIPGENPGDYQFEQAPHIKDSDNVGVIDVDTTLDLHPINDAKDKKEEDSETTMEDLLKDLIDELDKRGYDKHASTVSSFVKESANEGYGFAAGSAVGVLAGIFPPANLIPPHVRALAGGSAGAAIAHYLSKNPEEKGRVETAKERLEYVANGLKALGVPTDKIMALGEGKFRAQDLSAFFDGDEAKASQVSSLGEEYTKSLAEFKSMIGDAKRSANTMSKSMRESERSSGLSGWARYSANGTTHKQFAEMWQSDPPEGFDADYSSFGKWYSEKKEELGRHFGPGEAMSFLRQDKRYLEENKKVEPAKEPVEEPAVAEEPAQEARKAPEAAMEATADNVRSSILRLLDGAVMRSMDGDTVYDSKRVRRMTRRILRAISGDRTIRDSGDQERAVQMAAEAVMVGDLNGKSFGELIAQQTAGKDDVQAQSHFDGIVWLFLQRVSGKKGMERRTERRLERLKRRSER